MSGKLLQAVWDYKGDDLNCSQAHMLARMAWYASDAGRDIYPRTKILFQQIKCSRATGFEILNHLKEMGFINPESDECGKVVDYSINLEKLGVIQEFDEHSSKLPLKKTRPESGLPQKDPSRIRTGTRPESGLPRPESGYIKTNKPLSIKNHNGSIEKESNKGLQLREKIVNFNYDEREVFEKLTSFKSIFRAVAAQMVIENSLGDIRYALERAAEKSAREPAAVLIEALYNRKQQASN